MATATSLPTVQPMTAYQTRFDPRHVLDDPIFRVIPDNDPVLSKREANVACAYNPDHVVHLIEKPMPKAGLGECVVHVRATGICG